MPESTPPYPPAGYPHPVARPAADPSPSTAGHTPRVAPNCQSQESSNSFCFPFNNLAKSRPNCYPPACYL
jgi:hypothetical protein